MFKIGVNGFGTIGRRVADAAQKQRDMKIVGVSSTSPSWKTHHVVTNIPFFVSLRDYSQDLLEQFKESTNSFMKFGIEPSGTIFDLMNEVDLIIDATPKGVGRKNKQNLYLTKNDLHAVFQGGEKSGIAKVTFNAHVNYKDAVGERYIRIPSCNTTAMLRYLHDIQEISDLKHVVVNLLKRGADPANPEKGPINDYVPTEIPTHHVYDAIASDPRLEGKLITYSVKVPVTLMHMHNVIAVGSFPSRDNILDTFYENSRLIVIGGYERTPTAAEIFEATGKRDIPQIMILEKTLHLHNDILVFSAYCHQESNIIPENIDAIRASLGFEDSLGSVNKTNKYLELENTKKQLESIFPVY